MMRISASPHVAPATSQPTEPQRTHTAAQV